MVSDRRYPPRMLFPTTVEAITPEFLTEVLGRPVAAIKATPLGHPQTSVVAALDVALVDGDSERLVAKLPRPDRANTALYAQEVQFYRGAARRLACVPRPWLAESGDDDDFLLLLEHVGGRHVPEGLDLPTARLALTAIASVHGMFWGEPGVLPVQVHRPEVAARLAATVRDEWEGVAARFPRHLPSPPPLDDLASEVEHLHPSTLTHNDLHAENVLDTGDRVVFVDWQNATYSTPMLDVANLICGCVRPDVQRHHWRALLGHYEAALIDAGGPPLPDVVARYATTTGMLFGWMMQYLAGVSDAEAAARSMLPVHWERLCAGVILPR